MKSNVYTKKGDSGKSSTISEKEIPKQRSIFNLLGQFDKLNSILGLFCSYEISDKDRLETRHIQNLLLEAGTEIASNNPQKNRWTKELVILENSIDRRDLKNTELKNFILPGGSTQASIIHLARTTCRELERMLWSWMDKQDKATFIELAKYVNRLSDWLFVLSRNLNGFGSKDIIWTSKKD